MHIVSVMNCDKFLLSYQVTFFGGIWCYDLKFVQDVNVAHLFTLVDFFLLVLLSIVRGRCIVLT